MQPTATQRVHVAMLEKYGTVPGLIHRHCTDCKHLVSTYNLTFHSRCTLCNVGRWALDASAYGQFVKKEGRR